MPSKILKFNTTQALTCFLINMYTSQGYRDYYDDEGSRPKVFVRYHEREILVICTDSYDLCCIIDIYTELKPKPLFNTVANVGYSSSERLIAFLETINPNKYVHLSGVSWPLIKDCEFEPGQTVREFLSYLVDGTVDALDALMILYNEVTDLDILEVDVENNPYYAIFTLQHTFGMGLGEILHYYDEYDCIFLGYAYSKSFIHQVLELECDHLWELHDLYYRDNYRLEEEPQPCQK